MVHLTVTPESALADEPVKIKAWGLLPQQIVTIRAWLKDEKGEIFYSRAFYVSDDEGKVDLQESPATGGDFRGVHPMGLFWALKPVTPNIRLIKRDVMGSPFEVHLELYSHLDYNVMPECSPKAIACLKRWYVAPGVKRFQIREGRIRGALFIPPVGLTFCLPSGSQVLVSPYVAILCLALGVAFIFREYNMRYKNLGDSPRPLQVHKASTKGEGPFPGVIDIYGWVEGLTEYKSSLLASRGFASLALAYFAYEDLPRILENMDLKYFEEAAQLLCNHPKVCGDGIGILSLSKGSEPALAMASYFPQVAATICTSGANAIYEHPHSYGDVTYPAIPYQDERILITNRGAVLSGMLDDPRKPEYQNSIIPLERARGPILFLVAENDHIYDSLFFAKEALARAQKYNKHDVYFKSYPGAGHIIEPPGFPHASVSKASFCVLPVSLGGEIVPHCLAQENSWKDILDFLRKNIPCSRRNKL
ncbi:acyl-coenzyme A amino acid N-acyltransferase 1-like [Mantella aurantiaca]